tara:strand:+ start:966 stop:1505 length:540 start_codon:yes stop_codon:yes gene_type:complete
VKWISLLLFCYLMLIVQISFVPDAIIAGSRPNLILLVLCFALFWFRNAQVFLWAILAGLICETFDAAIPGTGILLLTCLVWMAFRVQTHFQIRSLFSRFVLMTVMAFAFDSVFQILNGLNAKTLPDLVSLTRHAGGNAVYTAVAGLGLLLACKFIQRLIPVDFGQNLQNRTTYPSRFSH